MSDMSCHSGRHLVPVYAAFAAALLASACGGGAMKTAEPGRDDRRAQINELAAKIDKLEARQTDSLPKLGVSGDGGDDNGDVRPDYSPEVLSVRPARAAPNIQPPEQAMCFARSQSRDRRCTDVCQLAGDICDNASNICRLSRELGDDEWAIERCTQASSSCERADQRCCKCT